MYSANPLDYLVQTVAHEAPCGYRATSGSPAKTPITAMNLTSAPGGFCLLGGRPQVRSLPVLQTAPFQGRVAKIRHQSGIISETLYTRRELLTPRTTRLLKHGFWTGRGLWKIFRPVRRSDILSITLRTPRTVGPLR